MWNLLTHRPHTTARKRNKPPAEHRNFGVRSQSQSSAPVIAGPDTIPEGGLRSGPKVGERGMLDTQAN
jgi:hypothetical protein